MRPLVSILIPAYNSQKWIKSTIESALAQTWASVEIIIVDDGSPDETYNVAKRYESKSLKVHKQENAGAAAARNKAYSLCQGDYIQWLDADDILEPDKIERQMEALQRYPGQDTLLSSCWGYFFYRTKKTNFEPTSLWKDQTPTEWLTNKLAKNLQMQTATWLVSRELTDKTGEWNTKLISDDDGEYFSRMLLHTKHIVFSNESKLHYRVAGSGSWGVLDNSDKKLEAQLESMKLHIDYLLSLENSKTTREACVYYLNTWSIYFYPRRMDLIRELERMAVKLGGSLKEPALPRKYKFIEQIFGWNAARKVSCELRKLRTNFNIALDKAMHRILD